jgi:drug/metabolite transporter (DMT)-like permease
MGYIAIVIGAVLSALNFPFLKSALATFTPYSLMTVRFIMATFIFLPIYLLFFKEKILKRSIKEVMLLSLFLFGGLALIVCGLDCTTVTSTHAITTLVPILTTIGSVILLKEAVKKRQYLGFVVGFLGLGVLTLNPLFSNGVQIGSLKGNLLVGLSTLCTTAYILYSKKVTRLISPHTTLMGTLICCTVLFTLTSLIEVALGHHLLLQPLTISNVWQLLYLSIFGTVIGFFTYQYGIKTASSFFAGLSIYIQFPVVILLGVFYYNETLTNLFILGVIMSVVGAFLAVNYKKT